MGERLDMMNRYAVSVLAAGTVALAGGCGVTKEGSVADLDRPEPTTSVETPFAPSEDPENLPVCATLPPIKRAGQTASGDSVYRLADGIECATPVYGDRVQGSVGTVSPSSRIARLCLLSNGRLEIALAGPNGTGDKGSVPVGPNTFADVAMPPPCQIPNIR